MEIVWTDIDVERFALAATTLNRPHVIDVLWLACLTGLRRADLFGPTWSEAGDRAIIRTAEKKRRGRRRRAAVPIVSETERLPAELRSRDRASGISHALLNSKG